MHDTLQTLGRGAHIIDPNHTAKIALAAPPARRSSREGAARLGVGQPNIPGRSSVRCALPMLRSSPVDGFRIAYERAGSGAPVVLLHGWPGDHGDYRDLIPLLTECADVVAPDLRGFGESDKHPEPPADAYSAAAQARSIVGLIEELRIAQTVARARSDLVGAIVVSPPLPGAGERVLTAQAQREFWYQAFHQLKLADEIIDGHQPAIRAYLRYFWEHWSGPAYHQTEADLDRLVSIYEGRGAFTSSIAWYRAGSGTVATSLAELSTEHPDQITVPTSVLWPEFDPLFPQGWSDRLHEFFSRATLSTLSGVGHFVPLEAPHELASAIRTALAALHQSE
jgi:pimeloyl-ACP methyl ester carboxylesterase